MYMGGFGGFYKGEKKKQKKGKTAKQQVSSDTSSAFVLPEIISRKKPVS